MLQSATIVSYISAAAFDRKLDYCLKQLEENNNEIVKIEFQHNWAFYSASVLYK